MEKVRAFLSDYFNLFFIFTVAAVSLFKLWVMNLFPVTADEAYYWLWHQHLQLSYVDHPPLIAYFNKVVSWFGEYNLFHFRLAGLILAMICTYFVYQIGKTLFDHRTGIIAATFFQLVPHYIVIWLTVTVDNPLALCWLLSLFFLVKLVQEGNPANWFGLGVSFGLGMLSKYTMGFFLLPLVLYMLIDRNARRWFFEWHPYVAALLSLLIFSPVIIWNVQSNYVSFLFHASRLGHSDFGQNLLSLIADQLVHFTPFLFLGLLIYSRQLWRRSGLLFLFSIPLLLTFAAFTYLIKVWAHWVMVYQLAALIGIAAMVAGNEKTARRMLVSLFIFALLVVVLILFGSRMILPRQAEYQKNYQLADSFRSLPQNTYIIAPFHGIASQLVFYGHRRTYMAQQYLKVEEHGFGQKQFDLWGGAPVKTGDNIIYYGKNDQATFAKLTAVFKAVKIMPQYDVYVIESYLDDLVPYYCRAFTAHNLLL